MNSIVSQAKTSLYGKFIESIKSLSENDSKFTVDFKVPTIVVIGTESSGKSSLLENITKCPIFPRDIRVCTKRPIHLNLYPLVDDEQPSYCYSYFDDDGNEQSWENDKMK